MCESGFLKIEPSNALEIEEPDGIIWKDRSVWQKSRPRLKSALDERSL
jgi:hypothetical protein